MGDVVSQLQGLVNGSRLVNPKKNATQDASIAQVAELLGAAEAAWSGVAAALRGALAGGVNVNDKVCCGGRMLGKQTVA